MLDVNPVPQVVYLPRLHESTTKQGNETGADTTFKRNMLPGEAVRDNHVCRTVAWTCPPSGPRYDGLMNKQYQANAAWIGDRAIPLPAGSDPLQPWPVDRPALQRPQPRHKPRTGREQRLHVRPGADHRLAAVRCANQRWRFEANPQGYELVASHSGKAFDMPNSNISSGAKMSRGFQRTGAINQTVRLRTGSTAGWRLLFADSGLAIAVQGGWERGTECVQQNFTGAANQLWDLRSRPDPHPGGFGSRKRGNGPWSVLVPGPVSRGA